MGAYAVVHQTAAGATLPIINITGSAAIRVHLFDLLIGSDATPADVATELTVGLTTTVGTGGTALTESPLDPLTVAATGAAIGGTFSGAPTFTANSERLMIALNQRATFRWVAVPGREIISTASANNGIELLSVASGGTPNINATMHWFE